MAVRRAPGRIRIDMSEYGEKYNVARLICSPGYVGYGEGGQPPKRSAASPTSVVLFDEIEKAHPEVFNSMLQIFEDNTSPTVRAARWTSATRLSSS